MQPTQQQTEDEEKIRFHVVQNPKITNSELYEWARAEGMVFSKHRTSALRKYHIGDYDESFTQVVESKLADRVRYVDTSPDRIQDYPFYQEIMNKWNNRKKLPWER